DVPVPLKIQWEESRHSATSTDEGTLQFNLLNEPNEPVLLPHTGGIGRSLFISCGLITIIIVGIYFHRKKEVA
ncbi:MAG: LPXTG cell wall anchor domain-containing protein, partial [Enterococcus devriesei]